MNKSYYERNDKSYILEEKENERIEDCKDNLEEILILENNMEGIKLRIEVTKHNIKLFSKDIKKIINKK